MPFKRIAFAVLALLFFAACGDKKEADHTLLPGNDIGCYDLLGDRAARYFEGTIENAEWQATFDCVKDQVTFFRKYVRGNRPTGYDPSDIAALVRKFLIVDHPVSDAFISSIFDIKASIFGGSPTIITSAEIDTFLSLSEFLRTESAALLPRLQAKHATPNATNLLGLADGLNLFGRHLSTYLKTLGGTMPVRKESFLPFVREILAIHGGDPTLVDRYGDFVRNLKVVVSGGTSDVIESETWPILVQEGAALGGLLYAHRAVRDTFFTQPGEKDQFEIDLMRRAQVTMNQVIRLHGTGIPLEAFDPVIDTYPWDELTPEKRVAIKKNLRPLVARALKGGVPGWLTSAAVATAIDLFENGMRQQIHLKKIYAALPASTKESEFESGAKKYREGLGQARDRDDVNALIGVAKSYVALFPEEGGRMVLSLALRNTRNLNQMEHMSWFQLFINHLFSIYATGPETTPGVKSAKPEDLAILIQDFYEVLQQWKMTNPMLTPLEMAKKRFREANLFTPSSNGDAFMDGIEGTYYLSFLFSSGSFSSSIFQDVANHSRDWSGCPIVGVDELGQDAFDPVCFRAVYFGHPEHFWANFPSLQVAYAKMTADQKTDLALSMEIASRTGGFTPDPLGPYDIDSFAALPHYVEDVMQRFDVNHDEVLDKREILDRAYPVFRSAISRAAPQAKNNDILLRGILTYIVKKGRAPKTTLDLLAWCALLPFTNVEADRLSLYRVVALLSEPLTPQPARAGNSSRKVSPLDQTNLFPTASAE